MTNRFGRETWSVLVPSGWHAWHDPECATLVGDPEIGALQISAAFKDTPVLDEDLNEFAAELLAAGAKAQSVVAGDFVGFEIAYTDAENSWRQWFLRHGKQALFVTYNCSTDDRGREDTAIAQVIASLSPTRTQPNRRR